MDFLLGNTYILAGIAAVVILVLGMVAMNAVGRKHTMDQKLRRLASEQGAQRHVEEGEEGLPEEKVKKSVLTTFLEMLLNMIGIDLEKAQRRLNLKFQQAGIATPYATINYMASKFLGIPLGLFIAMLLLSSEASGSMKMALVVAALMAAVLGIFGPDIYLRNAKDKRKEKLMVSFPDALDLILVCVESGLALDAALARVCSELERAHPEIAREFNRTRMELTLLNNRERALHNLGERTDLMPFRALIASLLQSERFGTSLVDTLRVLSEDYRTTRLMIAENKAGKLPALITIPLICCMLPALMLILMGPAIISIYETYISN